MGGRRVQVSSCRTLASGCLAMSDRASRITRTGGGHTVVRPSQARRKAATTLHMHMREEDKGGSRGSKGGEWSLRATLIHHPKCSMGRRWSHPGITI